MSGRAADPGERFLRRDDVNPYTAFREKASNSEEGPCEGVEEAVRRLLRHPRQAHDLRAFQSVRTVLEMIRKEIVEGSGLPSCRRESLCRLLEEAARPPQIEVRDVPPPDPAPLPDAAALAGCILELALRDRPRD